VNLYFDSFPGRQFSTRGSAMYVGCDADESL